MVFNAQGAGYGSYNDSVVGPESETDRQTFQIDPSSGGGAEGLGDYQSLNSILPPHPGPRAADVWGENTGGVRFIAPATYFGEDS